MELVVATKNRGKFREIEEALRVGVQYIEPLQRLIPLWEIPGAPIVQENGTTFRENALRKAREVCRFTGKPTLADDSGLVVDALGGRPGVHSARYTGEGASDQDNIDRLLSEMEGIPAERRTARYVCVLALVLPEGREVVLEERCEGSIAEGPQGAHGFGYDPIFFLPGFGKTMAEIDLAVKNRISHRGRALERLKEIL